MKCEPKWKLPQLAELSRAAGDNIWIRLRREGEQLSQPQTRWSPTVSGSGQLRQRSFQLRSVIDQLRDQTLANEDWHKSVSKRWVGRHRTIARSIPGWPFESSDLMLVGTIVEFGQPGIEAIQAAVQSATEPTRRVYC